MDNRDYSKSIEHEKQNWPAAASRLFNGFCIRRASWPEGDYAFMAKSAIYTAVDWTTGTVENFLVKKIGFKDVIWVPLDPEDIQATDWQVYTRQETHSFPRYDEQRNTRTTEPEIEVIDYVVDGNNSR